MELGARIQVLEAVPTIADCEVPIRLARGLPVPVARALEKNPFAGLHGFNPPRL